MRVFVKNKRGENLMPCTQRKARLLLKQGNATIYKYNPFTIQLTNASGETIQECNVGINTGAKSIGIAITSKDKVMFKAEVKLRQDIKSNLDTRRDCRKSRRNRKTRYRQARFLNRRKVYKWLPPTLQNRITHIFRWTDEFCNLLPNPKLHIEVGKFDIAKVMNQDIRGFDCNYEKAYDFFRKRYYVFARDNYTCQCCGKSKDKILHAHHIIYRSNGGTNRVNNLITVCSECHTYENHQEGGILYGWATKKKKVKEYNERLFISAARKQIINRYRNAAITYGSETTPRRKEMGLEKTYYNDAIAISGIRNILVNHNEWLLIKQFRKKKRSLHEATIRKGIKEPNREQKRNSKNTPYRKGFYLNDKVLVFGQYGYITGFSGNAAYVKNLNDEYISAPNKNYKQIGLSNISLVNHNNNWQYIRKESNN